MDRVEDLVIHSAFYSLFQKYLLSTDLGDTRFDARNTKSMGEAV